MTVKEFCDEIWTRKNVPILICPERAYEDMFDLVDDINDGKTKIEDINNNEYVMGAYLPYFTQYTLEYMCAERFAQAELTHFYVGQGISIIWIKMGGDEE